MYMNCVMLVVNPHECHAAAVLEQLCGIGHAALCEAAILTILLCGYIHLGGLLIYMIGMLSYCHF